MNIKSCASRLTCLTILIYAAVLLFCGTSAHAQLERVWSGTEDSRWTYGGADGNWSGLGAPLNTTEPANASRAIAVFTGPLTPNQPNVNVESRGIFGLRFESTGWTISGSGVDTPGETIGGTLRIGPGGIDAAGVTSGTVTLNVNVNLTNYSAPILVGTGGTLEIMGTTTRSGNNTPSLDIGGTNANQRGTVILHGTSTLHRTTRIYGGTLKLVGNGSLGTGTLQLNHSQAFFDISEINTSSYQIIGSDEGTADLSGIGTIYAAGKTLVVTGNLRPGADAGAERGLLTVAGPDAGLTLGTSTTLSIADATRGSGYDAVDIGGLLTYGGTLNIDFANEITGIFNLFNFDSHAGSFDAIQITGAFGSDSLLEESGIWSAQIGDNWFTFDNTTGDLQVSIIPEPATVTLLLITGVGGAILFRRRTHA